METLKEFSTVLKIFYDIRLPFLTGLHMVYVSLFKREQF